MGKIRKRMLFINSMNKLEAFEVNNSNIKQMLFTIGIKPTEELILDIIGFFKGNEVNFTMRNLFIYLQHKSIVQSNTKTANSKVNIINEAIIDYTNFNTNMINKGYSEFTREFLVKTIDDVVVNVTRDQNEVSAITSYDLNQNIIDTPDEILSMVKNDIMECNI